MDRMKKYYNWMENPYFDEETKQELRELSEEEIIERFSKDLKFGTGGLRGELGAGTNRMNRYTVRKATQGLANKICRDHMQEKGVVIAYDSRNYSQEFAEEAALCLCANEIPVYVFNELRPTPELSYAVRRLGCSAGIVITASHNPKEYNGYKVYWEDGGQITSPIDHQIMDEIEKIKDFSEVKTMEKSSALEKGLYRIIDSEMDQMYQKELLKLRICPEAIEQQAENIKIVYTPLNGTGYKPVRALLKALGFHQTYGVEEQDKPDGNFPTIPYPNPEDEKAFTLALKKAKQVGADLVLATDPDADRLGVYCKDKNGEYHSFTGNMTGILLGEYLINQKAKKNALPKNGVIVRTIVSSPMMDKIAQTYHLSVRNVLTGFKYIGEQIKCMEEAGKEEFIFGFEESYGCLFGTYARDKDAVAAVMLLCEACAYYRMENKTLWDRMQELYEKYGYYKEKLHSVTLKGEKGSQQIEQLMEQLRDKEFINQAPLHIIRKIDYKTDHTGLPKANVIYFELEDGWFCVRPSGTEPKIKLYYGIWKESMEKAEGKLEELSAIVEKWLGLEIK